MIACRLTRFLPFSLCIAPADRAFVALPLSMLAPVGRLPYAIISHQCEACKPPYIQELGLGLSAAISVLRDLEPASTKDGLGLPADTPRPTPLLPYRAQVVQPRSDRQRRKKEGRKGKKKKKKNLCVSTSISPAKEKSFKFLSPFGPVHPIAKAPRALTLSGLGVGSHYSPARAGLSVACHYRLACWEITSTCHHIPGEAFEEPKKNPARRQGGALEATVEESLLRPAGIPPLAGRKCPSYISWRLALQRNARGWLAGWLAGLQNSRIKSRKGRTRLGRCAELQLRPEGKSGNPIEQRVLLCCYRRGPRTSQGASAFPQWPAVCSHA